MKMTVVLWFLIFTTAMAFIQKEDVKEVQEAKEVESPPEKLKNPSSMRDASKKTGIIAKAKAKVESREWAKRAITEVNKPIPQNLKKPTIVFPNKWGNIEVKQPKVFIDVNGKEIEKADPKVNYIRRDQIARAAGVHVQFVGGNLKIGKGYLYFLPYDEAVVEVERLKKFAIKQKEQREKAAKLRKRLEENRRK